MFSAAGVLTGDHENEFPDDVRGLDDERDRVVELGGEAWKWSARATISVEAVEYGQRRTGFDEDQDDGGERHGARMCW